MKQIKHFQKQKKHLLNEENYQNLMFRLVKGLKTDSKEVEGGRCMRGSDGRLCFSKK